MAQEFRLPDLGSGLQEAQIVNWHVAVGDAVTSDDTLCEVETEKSVIEVPVPFDGVVLSMAAEAGDTINVGDVLAVFGEAGESASAPPAAAPVAGPGGSVAGIAEADPPPAIGEPATSRPRAMPSARRLAREHELNLEQIQGTGKGGRITGADVRRAAAERAPAPTSSFAGERVPLSMLRRTIGDHMARSWREIPHCFTRLEIDASRLLEARAALSDRFARKLPVEALLVKAAIPALRAFPAFNATLDGDAVIHHAHYDIGVAADTPDGLIVPVVKGADRLDMEALADRISELFASTAQRRTPPEELSGATFTVNNIGALGHVIGTSIIPHGTTAILSCGRAVEKPVVRNGAIQIAPVLELTLSFDHRVIDGGLVQRFMAHVGNNLEQPVRFLV